MEFASFKKLALTTLLGHQLDNGSWFNNPVSTISAVEGLCEELSGPDPVCSSSVIYREIRPSGIDRYPMWPLRLTRRGGIGEYSGDESEAYRAAIGNALWRPPEIVFSDDPLNLSRVWVVAKWLRVSALLDPDYQLVYEGVYPELMNFKTKEPWLLAQIALAAIHSDLTWGFYGKLDGTVRRDFVRRSRDILQLADVDHWRGLSVTPDEATAIVGTFIFHECLLYLWEQESDVDIVSYHDRILTWLLARQSDKGSWSESPHTTAQCLMSLDTFLANTRADDTRTPAVIAAIGKGLEYLLAPEIQDQWIALDDYQHINILSLLIRLSKRVGAVKGRLDALDIDGSRFAPKVFISYGGPDESFARRLAVDFEASGIRVWFAAWDVDYGDDVVQEINNGLQAARKFVIVLSPEAVKRSWVKKELSAAFNQALTDSDRLIIPVMYRHTELPPFLAAHRWVDFTNDQDYVARASELVRRLKGRKPPRA